MPNLDSKFENFWEVWKRVVSQKSGRIIAGLWSGKWEINALRQK